MTKSDLQVGMVVRTRVGEIKTLDQETINYKRADLTSVVAKKDDIMEVYEPSEDSYLLEKYVKEFSKGLVLDIGTGTGIQAKAAFKKAAPHRGK